MSAGQKMKSEKSLSTPRSDQPAATGNKEAPLPAESSKKAGFAQGTYYRQGVLVPGGPPKGAMLRGRSR
jgi:hypothetical protein